MQKAIAVAMVIVLTASLAGCACIIKTVALDPSVDVLSVTIEESTFSRTTIIVDVRIKNRNPVGATVERIEHDIYFGHKGDWRYLGNGTNEDLSLGANASSDFQVTTELKNRRAIMLLLDFMFGDETPELKIKGTAWIKIGPGTFEVPFEEVVDALEIL